MEKKEAFKFTGEDAENYDHYLGPILFEPYGQYLASQIDTAHVKSVLEIACGTGRVTRHIRNALSNNTEFYATDISNDMLNVARHALSNSNINFSIEDVQSLSFPDNSFDLVIFQFGMMFLPDKNKGLEEIFRVLRPGGKLMIFTWDDTLNMPLFKLLINDLVLPYFKDEENTDRFFVPFSIHDRLLLESLTKNSGFKSTKINHVAIKSGPHLSENIVTGLFRKHPLGREILAKGASAYEQVAKKLENGITEIYGAGNTVIDLSALLTISEK